MLWVKKNNPSFDVTMGAFDGTEICELVGLYILSKMQKKFKQLDACLYRDDGLGCYSKKLSGTQVERLKKDIIKLYQEEGLQITIEANIVQADFLDVTLDLPTGKFWPFRKPDDLPVYIHKDSNHPASIKKELPKMIQNRISKLSCNEEEFNKAKPMYEAALRASGFAQPFKYDVTAHQPAPAPTRRSRRRKIIWFNPPYNQAVRQNVGKQFLALLDKHFPKDHKYHHLFNRNTVKLSYSCTTNMKNIISGHSKGILRRAQADGVEPNDAKTCNCTKQNKPNCPLKNECLTEAVVYQASVESNSVVKKYIGLTENAFKTRFNAHTHTLNNSAKKDATALSSHVWDLKESDAPFTIKWEILKQSVPYKCGSRICDLCLSEKLLILLSDPSSCLNKRSELISKCRHSLKFKLRGIT